MVYNPSTLEWGILLAGLIIGIGTGAGYSVIAFAFRWKVWYKREDVPKPRLFIPELYALFRNVACLLGGLGLYLVLREAVRWEMLPLGFPKPNTDTPPSQDNLMAFMVLYILFAFFSGIYGLAFFNVGLQMSWISIPMLTEGISFGLCVGLAIVSGLIWYAPAILFAIAGAFFLYSMILNIWFMIKSWSLKNSGIFWDPIDCIIQDQQYLRSKLEALFQRMEEDDDKPSRKSRSSTSIDIEDEDVEEERAPLGRQRQFAPRTPVHNNQSPAYPFVTNLITARLY